MKNWINRVLDVGRKYTILDFSIFKLCLFSFGVIFGVYFSSFFTDYISIVWTVFIVTYIWIIYRTFIKHMRS